MDSLQLNKNCLTASTLCRSSQNPNPLPFVPQIRIQVSERLETLELATTNVGTCPRAPQNKQFFFPVPDFQGTMPQVSYGPAAGAN